MKAYFQSLALVVIALTSAASAYAQTDYPTRNIRLLFGFSAGNDVGTRIVAEKLAESLGMPVTVENATGAAGNIAADKTAYSDPDGYTIGMLTGANIVLRPLLYSSIPYDPLKKLTPVSLAYRLPNILVVNKSLAAATLGELVERARADPGALTFGHLGNGSVTHLSGELLKIKANIDIRGVPYRGAPALLTDILGGRVDMAFLPPSAALPLARGGDIRALASTSRTREAFAPDLPTVAEAGYPDLETTVWFGLFVPAETPHPIIGRLSKEVETAMALPEVQKRFTEIGLAPIGSTPSEFDEVIQREKIFWSKLIEEVGLKPIN
jgi:tripartite-type tricarboxylate transporter receptor subunit TctC